MTEAANYQTLQVRKEGAIDWLSLDRPDRLNALNMTMVGELNDYLERLMTDASVRIVVVRGNGRAFCSGIDIKDINQGHGAVANGISADIAAQRRIAEVVRRMRRCPQPIIALVHGIATGGGFSLALAADIRIAGESARMNCAFINLGLTSCDLGLSYLLPRIVGTSISAELMLTGRFIEAERALRTNLVSEVVPDGDMEAAARSYLDEMIATSHLGLRLTKEGMNMGIDAPGLEHAIAMEDRNQVLTLQSDNFQEGMAAILEKRSPRFDQ